MANAKQAPLKTAAVEIEIDGEKVIEGSLEHQVLSQEYDTEKKYLFELVRRNEEREHPIYDMDARRSIRTRPFKPKQNIVLSSQIVWKGQRRMIRYYDGCTTIFVDKQPQDKDLIAQLIKGTSKEKYNFINGKFGAYGDEKMLLRYLNICSWSEDSPFRTRTATPIFKAVNAEKLATLESQKLDLTEKAFAAAKEASDTKMRIHAAYLGIATTDWDSGNERTETEIRTDYRKWALKNPQAFMESYGNETLETKYFIQRAWEQGLITNTLNPNLAHWKSGTEICDISGMKSVEGIVSTIYEFSQLPQGEEFLLQLKAIYEN